MVLSNLVKHNLKCLTSHIGRVIQIPVVLHLQLFLGRSLFHKALYHILAHIVFLEAILFVIHIDVWDRDESEEDVGP